VGEKKKPEPSYEKSLKDGKREKKGKLQHVGENTGVSERGCSGMGGTKKRRWEPRGGVQKTSLMM